MVCAMFTCFFHDHSLLSLLLQNPYSTIRPSPILSPPVFSQWELLEALQLSFSSSSFSLRLYLWRFTMSITVAPKRIPASPAAPGAGMSFITTKVTNFPRPQKPLLAMEILLERNIVIELGDQRHHHEEEENVPDMMKLRD
ncbi:unnamed protein product [Cuscuta epithymum]|uniref:Uncharacterized protein n=1 Tax=Cuscuta epithymum TaxID=186058 RepID=A0AAV0F8Q2_9ASTE|nr:unnamed protein product [Cuscuta epithymum]